MHISISHFSMSSNTFYMEKTVEIEILYLTEYLLLKPIKQ